MNKWHDFHICWQKTFLLPHLFLQDFFLKEKFTKTQTRVFWCYKRIFQIVDKENDKLWLTAASASETDFLVPKEKLCQIYIFWVSCHFHWRIQGAPGTRAHTLGPIFFIFMQFLGGLAKIIGWLPTIAVGTLLWEILDPPLIFDMNIYSFYQTWFHNVCRHLRTLILMQIDNGVLPSTFWRMWEGYVFIPVCLSTGGGTP